jgi:arylsulfatase A-like enzyme
MTERGGEGLAHSTQIPQMMVSKRRAALLLTLFVASLAIKVVAVRQLLPGVGGLSPGTLIDIARVAAVVILVDLFLPDRRVRPLIVADALLSTVLLSVLLFVGFYDQLPTRESLGLLRQAGTVSGGIATLLRPVHVLFFADVIVLGVWSVLGAPALSGRTQIPEPQPESLTRARKRPSYPYQSKWVYLSLIPIAAIALLSDQVVAQMPRPLEAQTAARNWGLVSYVTATLTIGDISVTPVAKNLDDPLEVQHSIDTLTDGRDGERFADFERGSAKGDNVIVIQMEALQSAAVGATLDGQSITPNLDRLIARSWYFDDFATQVGQGTTSDAEFMVNTSLYPPTTGAAALKYGGKVLPSLPRLLRARGYDALTFHTNTAQYWNRTQLYPALGFSEYFDRAFFGSQETIALGASDKVLYAKTFQELKRRRASGRPFYAQIITLSSHYPFTGVPDAERKLKLRPPYIGARVGDYLTEIQYADRQLGTFLDELEASGMLKDTIVVVYGDHFGIRDTSTEPREDVAVRDLLGRAYSPVDLVNVPLVIHMPGQTAGARVSDTLGQIDLMPTLADPLGIDLAAVPHFGRDGFVRTRPFLSGAGFVGANSYLDGALLYLPAGVGSKPTAFALTSRETTALPSEAAAAVGRVRDLRRLSDQYVASLPDRADFDPSAKVVLPEEIQGR